MTKRLLDGECLRSTVHEREQVHAEGRLERCHFVELIEDHVFRHVLLQLDYDAHAFAA